MIGMNIYCGGNNWKNWIIMEIYTLIGIGLIRCPKGIRGYVGNDWNGTEMIVFLCRNDKIRMGMKGSGWYRIGIVIRREMFIYRRPSSIDNSFLLRELLVWLLMQKAFIWLPVIIHLKEIHVN